MHFEIQVQERGDAIRVTILGELDLATAPELERTLGEIEASTAATIILDLDQVEFLDSTGLGVLVGGLKRVRAHEGSLRLVCTQERILKIFRITGLTKVFPIHSTVDEALTATD